MSRMSLASKCRIFVLRCADLYERSVTQRWRMKEIDR